ncbi:lactam utilization protein lamb [Pseudomassariella vexata]|uniref:Lactam utilization protein lamb n=1 Tax=Pseudomassariella vexata TaxID=1141098 RepID=A0A1Y2D8U1_9PEZI|nr:lactam utilization protein lamb [Pseudomassariella vexata]ORY55680.1 lactam utilization protein lamb [Pseudomassariella vexata]
MAPVKCKAMINVDLGEAYGNYKCGPDEELIPMIDHANIACGFHQLLVLAVLLFMPTKSLTSDPLVMSQAVHLSKTHNIKIGAHPGLPDIQGFGRREMTLTPEEHTANIIYQVGALQGFLSQADVPLHHVKPHGVLYGMMCRDIRIARAVLKGVPPGVPVFGLAGTCFEQAANELGIEFWAEFYGDVKYRKDGSLIVDRKKQPWKIEDVKRHVRQQLEETAVTAVTGETVQLEVKEYPVTICCHSDSPGAVEIVRATREVVDDFNRANGFV